MFGEFVREKRLEAGLEYLRFSDRIGMNPEYWNKIERGVIKPPTDIKTLLSIADSLGISVGSGDWLKLTEFAAQGQQTSPKAVLDDAEILNMLPVLCRSNSADPDSLNDVTRLKKVIKKAHNA